MTTFKSKCGNFYIKIGNNECGFFIALYNYKTDEYPIKVSCIEQAEAIGILNDLLKQFCWKGENMNIKRIQRIKQRATYEAKDLLSTSLFSTKKHSYNVGDMITLFSFMILLCAFVYISLIIGIK